MGVWVCVGGISESNTVNKQDGWGEREGEEKNMEVLFITPVGEGDGESVLCSRVFLWNVGLIWCLIETIL